MFTLHLSTIAPVKSSFWWHFHAADQRVGSRFSCASAGQGKTTASNGPDSVISLGLFLFYFFFHFSIPFDAPAKQDDPREHKWKFDNSFLFFFFFLFLPFFSSWQAAHLRLVKRLNQSHWYSPPCPSFRFVLTASVRGKEPPCSLTLPWSFSPGFDLWHVTGGEGVQGISDSRGF